MPGRSRSEGMRATATAPMPPKRTTAAAASTPAETSATPGTTAVATSTPLRTVAAATSPPMMPRLARVPTTEGLVQKVAEDRRFPERIQRGSREDPERIQRGSREDPERIQVQRTEGRDRKQDTEDIYAEFHVCWTMEHQKRNIIKPTRYQTTSSDEDVRTRTVKKTYTTQKTSNIMSQDINELKHIFKNSSNIIENTAFNTQHTYDTQTVQYLPSSQIPQQTSQQSQQSQQCQYMSTAFALYNDDESQNNDNESEKEETTSAARHAFQRNENNYDEITYTNLDEHFSQNLGNRRLVEQDNIVDIY